jgi:hypothetical protein
VVDGVGNGILAGSTCIGEGGRITDTGAGGASAGASAGVGAGAVGGGTGGGWEKKNEGPGS